MPLVRQIRTRKKVYIKSKLQQMKTDKVNLSNPVQLETSNECFGVKQVIDIYSKSEAFSVDVQIFFKTV